MRHNSSRLGFSFVEIIIAGAMVVGLGFLGYTFYNSYQAKKALTTAATVAPVSHAAASVPSAPAITTTAELDSASAVIDQTDTQTSNSNDLSQLDSELSNF